MKSRKMSEKEAFDRLPVRFQQTVLVIANIVKRIAKQRQIEMGACPRQG